MARLMLAGPYMESVPFSHDSGPIGQIQYIFEKCDTFHGRLFVNTTIQ